MIKMKEDWMKRCRLKKERENVMMKMDENFAMVMMMMVVVVGVRKELL